MQSPSHRQQKYRWLSGWVMIISALQKHLEKRSRRVRRLEGPEVFEEGAIADERLEKTKKRKDRMVDVRAEEVDCFEEKMELMECGSVMLAGN